MALEWTGETAGEITKALGSAFPDLARLDQMVFSVLNAHLNTFADVANDHPTVIFQLCISVDAKGDLEKLIKGAHQENPGNAELKALHQRHFGASVSGPVVIPLYKRCILDDDAVFFDRKPFREKLKRINDYEARRILVVKGGDKCGKTYSNKLIRLEAKENDYKTISIKLKKLDLEKSVESLARYLVGRINPKSLSDPVPEQGTESEVRWAHHPLMAWTLGWIESAERTCWVIIDEFDKDLVSPDVYHFLTHLAAEIEDDLPRCRLAMLGYDREIPPEWDQRHRLEEIEELEQEHLEDFFKGLFLEKNIEPDTQTARDLAKEFFAKYQQRVTDFANDQSGEIESPLRYLNGELKKRFAGTKPQEPE